MNPWHYSPAWIEVKKEPPKEHDLILVACDCDVQMARREDDKYICPIERKPFSGVTHWLFPPMHPDTLGVPHYLRDGK